MPLKLFAFARFDERIIAYALINQFWRDYQFWMDYRQSGNY